MNESRRRLAASDRRALVTPEGVVLELELARLSQRCWAFLLDVVIIIVVLVVLTLVVVFAGGALVIGGGRGATDPLLPILAAIWLLLGFVLRNLWAVLFEAGRHTATPGKRMLGIRVVARDGGRLTADAVVARNLMRELEFFLPLSFVFYQAGAGTVTAWTALAGIGWSIAFALVPLFNRDRLRVGDLVAGTWVLRVPRRRLGADLVATAATPAASGFHFTDSQLDAYGVYELQTLEDVLRRGTPNAMRRPAGDPVTVVAAAIRAKIGYRGGDDYEFLAAYYAALRARLERGLLFGRRRRDKRDHGQAPAD